ncbi:hypothetical protein PCANC_07390 [Puccinia coronata f. sp. avenae]|uniref:HAT C-terminal dimerisation domain-containing protein n=1 Tax=Puccinia coronata f. sp. avenae TaxID=200324 RepID=A0A2N5T5B9_9BASI|nr:hypothetical protein PCANC_07390 [Puccinia coronata f. sp. avenae]
MAQDEDTEVTDDTDTPCTPPNTSDVLSNLPQSTCRESSRICTPITCPGFIPTQTQSHQAAASKCYASTSAKGNQQKTTSINSSNGSSSSNNEVTKETASAQVKQVRRRTGDVIDIDTTQDSDEENCQAPAGKRKDLEKDKDRFDHSQLYFYPPGLGPNQDSLSTSWACQWFKKEYVALGGSYYNLKAHRDGAMVKGLVRSACQGRLKAIEAGGNFPPSVSELVSQKATSQPAGVGTLIAFATKGKFDNNTLNHLIVTWIIQQSLPWLRIKDFHLYVAFDHAVHNYQLHSWIWAASQACQLYLELRTQVIKDIMESKSKILLVSDVWTTKGSNNFTMAKGVAAILRKFDATRWDVQNNHHRCVCHVIALIFGAGLKALKLPTKMVRAKKEDHPFPLLETIIKEDEPEETTNQEIVEVGKTVDLSDDEVDPEDAEEGLAQPGWEWDNEDDKSNQCDEKGIGYTLKKIDYICCQIALSPQKRSEWKLCASKLEFKGRGLIAGYRIRCNIDYDSRERAYEGRRVITKLLEKEDDKYAGKSAADHFLKSYALGAKEWEDVNNLNNVLKEFLDMTKQMKGDYPKLSMVLYKYIWLQDSLSKQKQAAMSTSLEAMFDPMLEITNKYTTLALNCDTVILATFLHPAWRMMLFNDCYKSHTTHITKLM